MTDDKKRTKRELTSAAKKIIRDDPELALAVAENLDFYTMSGAADALEMRNRQRFHAIVERGHHGGVLTIEAKGPDGGRAAKLVPGSEVKRLRKIRARL